MWLRKLSWKMRGAILASLLLLLVGIMSYALRPQPPFNFLQGHRPVRTDDDFHTYELFGGSEALSRRIEDELFFYGVKATTEKRWAKGRKAEFRTADELRHVFLVSETDQTQPLSIWIRLSRARSRLNMITKDILSVLTFTSRNRGYSPVNVCITNMRQIEGAQETWAIENPRRTNEIPSDADLFGPKAYIRVKPECPEGGRYIRGNIGEHPHCSVPWHDME